MFLCRNYTLKFENIQEQGFLSGFIGFLLEKI
jgi:hypothetical protein